MRRGGGVELGMQARRISGRQNERGWSRFLGRVRRQYRWRITAAGRRFSGELGQIRMRLLYAIGIWTYVLIAIVVFGEALPNLSAPLLIVTAGTIVALALAAHLLVTLRRSHVRRVIGMVHDIGALSLFMHFGGAVTAPFFPIYLWIVLGNGFRFGVSYLLGAGALSVVCFGLVVATTPVWAEQLLLSSGLLGSLIVIPAYVSSLIRQLHRARADAERASAAKSEFLATVSHEVRTPLNAIIGLSDILRAAPLEGEQRQMVRSIGTAGRALLELMSDILSLARIEAGRQDRRDEAVSLYHLLAELEAITAPQARAKGLLLSLQIGLDIPQRVLLDRRHLQKVLINLLVNAIKFTDQGMVRLRLERCAEGARDELCLTVSDSGRGIPEAEQGAIFESFTQSSLNRRDSDGGAGLGLAIVKRLVELMDGSIDLESRLGEGATFRVRLPLVEVVREAQEADGAAPALASPLFAPAGVLPELRSLLGARCPRLIEADSTDALIEKVAGWARETGERPVVFLPHSAGDREALLEAAARLDALGLFAPPLLVAVRLDAGEAPEGDLPPQVLATISADAGEGEVANLLSLVAILLDHQAGTAERETAGAAPAARALNVLVAEDNRVNRQIAERILEQLGHRVDCVEDGEAVLEAIETARYDVIFMDVNMPALNGLEATQMIRAMEGSDHRTPIIGLTADATAEARRQCEEAGMDAVTFKPVSPAAIRTVLARVLPQEAMEGDEEAGAGNVITHPQLQNPRAPVIETEKLAELETICPEDLLERLKAEFVEDAETLLEEIREAVTARDLRAFRDTAHAIRSMAANMGAARLLGLCNRCRSFASDTLREQGEAFLSELEHEIALVREALLPAGESPVVRRGFKDRR